MFSAAISLLDAAPPKVAPLHETILYSSDRITESDSSYEELNASDNQDPTLNDTTHSSQGYLYAVTESMYNAWAYYFPTQTASTENS